LEAALARLGFLQTPQLRARELLDLAAFRADQVLAHRLLSVRVLVALAALAGIVRGVQAAPPPHLERTVARRLADAAAPVPRPRLDVLDRQVVSTREDDRRDRFALLRHRQALVAQVSAEEVREAHARGLEKGNRYQQ